MVSTAREPKPLPTAGVQVEKSTHVGGRRRNAANDADGVVVGGRRDGDTDAEGSSGVADSRVVGVDANVAAARKVEDACDADDEIDGDAVTIGDALPSRDAAKDANGSVANAVAEMTAV